MKAIPIQVKEVIEYVRTFAPQTSHVVFFNRDNDPDWPAWLFLDGQGDPVKFPKDVDTSVLEEALDYCILEIGLPIIYSFY